MNYFLVAGDVIPIIARIGLSLIIHTNYFLMNLCMCKLTMNFDNFDRLCEIM